LRGGTLFYEGSSEHSTEDVMIEPISSAITDFDIKQSSFDNRNRSRHAALPDLIMNVSLTPELEALVHDKVKSGRYLSASEVVREGLRLLEERDHLYQARLADLQKEINLGVEQSDRGEVLDGETVIQELLNEINQARLAQ
jgi:antitoxin ParD1/3/4